MQKAVVACLLLLVTAGFGHKILAQDQPTTKQPPSSHEPAPPDHFYHLDFVVEDLNAEGNVVNSRSYSTIVSTNARGTMSIRSGSKIPIATGLYSASGDVKEPSSLVNTQFQYEDIGASFDVRDAHEVDGQLAFDLVAALSSVAAVDPNLHEPVIRENKWQASVLIPIGKQSVAFSSDIVDSKGSTRVLVTATPIQ